MDGWKAPEDADFAYEVKEINSLDEGPTTTSGIGESIGRIDEDGDRVSTAEGPDHPTKTNSNTRRGLTG